jgi:hypothetical protein
MMEKLTVFYIIPNLDYLADSKIATAALTRFVLEGTNLKPE